MAYVLCMVQTHGCAFIGMLVEWTSSLRVHTPHALCMQLYTVQQQQFCGAVLMRHSTLGYLKVTTRVAVLLVPLLCHACSRTTALPT
jgi:hypothetical protein